ncbi:MAG: sialate O-acetylesterase [Janthinobacterium lividum]
MKKFITYSFLLGLGVILGIVANRNREYLINAQFIRNHWHFRKVIPEKDKIIKSEKTMIILAFGQSNSADYGKGIYNCKNEVYNYYKGDLYRAKEPLLGADGSGSSVWTRVADMVIDSGLYKKVIIIPCGIGQTSVQCWSDGDCRKTLEETLDYLKKDNISLTHIFWDQGETDNVDKTTKDEYKQRLKNVISIVRKKGFSADFYCSLTSYVPFNNNNPLGINKAILGAQQETIKEVQHVKEGPNTDLLNLAYDRFDYLHFTEHGLDKLAYEWYKKIKINHQ